jgi:hypothetical protein
VISIGGFFGCIGGILAISFGSKYQKPNTLWIALLHSVIVYSTPWMEGCEF